MCFDDDARPPIPVSENGGAHGHALHLAASDGASVAAYLAEPSGSASAGILVLPDVRGLHEFYRQLALRFADAGMLVLAIDYFARTAQTDERDSSFEYGPHVGAMMTDTFDRDLAAGVGALRQRGQNLPLVTVGFCMGGNLSFQAGTRGLGLAGVVGFYAGLTRTMGAVTPVAEWASRIECPVLGLFGGADPHITQDQIDDFERQLEAGNVPHEIVVYPGAPHSFFDRRAVEFAGASADAWNRIQGFVAGAGAVSV